MFFSICNIKVTVCDRYSYPTNRLLGFGEISSVAFVGDLYLSVNMIETE